MCVRSVYLIITIGSNLIIWPITFEYVVDPWKEQLSDFWSNEFILQFYNILQYFYEQYI